MKDEWFRIISTKWLVFHEHETNEITKGFAYFQQF